MASPLTPTGRPARARRRVSAKKELFPVLQPGGSVETWTEEENKALVEFVLFYGDGKTWPSHSKGSKFWVDAAEYVYCRCGSTKKRTAGACRLRIVSRFPKMFSTPVEAECHYLRQKETQPVQSVESSGSSKVDMGTQTDTSCLRMVPPSATEVNHVLQYMPKDEQLSTIEVWFQTFSLTHYGVNVHRDFLSLCLSAFKHLQQCNRSNVVYELAKGVGTMRSNGSDSRFPAKRMPMGMIEYMVKFFTSKNLQKGMTVPDDYKQWLTTMYCQFGNKWASLHLGPMWSLVPTEQGQTSQIMSTRDPMDARVNIPGPSSRTLRRYIADNPVTPTSNIQMHVLDEAKRHSKPDTWWWIKADGCDILPGVAESMKGVWSGDVDLNDGHLEEQKASYKNRLSEIERLSMVDRASLVEQLCFQIDALQKDKEFLLSALPQAQEAYEEKIKSSKAPQNVLLKLAWTVQEQQELLTTVSQLIVDSSTLKDQLQDECYDPVRQNTAKALKSLQNQLIDMVRRLSKHQRTAATHIFVIMVSAESRSRKPYALPVQCLPIKALKDQQVRDIANKLITAMVERGMNVAGFTTNGEFNSLRWKGNTRPLTVLQLKREAREKYQNKGEKTLLRMIMPVVSTDGTICTHKENPAVPKELLAEILTWKREGAREIDIVTKLRQRTVPKGYTPHSWKPGKTETPVEMLRSILAQLQYQYEILEWGKKGVPFRSHLYVPELHPVTGEPFHEREDEAHVFKRIAQSLREGGPQELKLERYMEALSDKDVQLSYHALIGSRKQSVSDAEQLFGLRVLSFFEKKKYTTEAEFVRIIRNWRRACDERGLSDSQRAQYNQDFLSYILTELMPWHSEPGMRDFSLLEVNQPVDCVRGFTRETLSAVIVDIESRDWRRHYNKQKGIPPEHPRASTSDDVECFFSILRDMVGRNFTHKEIMFEWRKACEEFTKRLDPDLPFFYYTSTHQRFFEGDQPDFNQPASRLRHEPRAARRELVAGNVGGRFALAERGTTSIRTRFHNVPVNLPPPPSMPTYITDHSYL